MNESEFPALYQAADAASKKAQKNFFIALGFNLAGLFVASVLSMINYPSAWFSIAQAIMLLVSLGFSIYLAHKQPQRIWYSTRALSESIKTISWRFMMRAEPYNISDLEARKHFLLSMKKILEANKHVCAHAVDMTSNNQLSNVMLTNRTLNLQERKKYYLEKRIEDQYNWYKKKAKINLLSSKKWFWSLIFVNGLAILFAMLKIIVPKASIWPTDIFVTGASAIMAWLQTKRFQELATSYALTAHEITLLNDNIPTSAEENDFSIFVADSENAFSREHTQWQARRDVD